MKKDRIAAALLALVLLVVLCVSTALAEPRYPAQTGVTTDVAALLSAETAEDLKQFSELLANRTDFRLTVVTVDFLDGSTIADYAAGLRQRWGLGENDLLLLMAAGEDSFGLFGGSRVLSKLPQTTQDKLLSTSFQEKFLQQDYDGAVNGLMPVLAREIGKVSGETVDVSGLFGQAAATATAAPTISTQEWLDRLASHAGTETPEPAVQRFTREDEVSGFSFGKVLLTVFLLLVIFGGSRSRRRGGCMGCGCAPFSSVLAGLGIYNLWNGDHRGPGRMPRGGMRGPGPRRW